MYTVLVAVHPERHGLQHQIDAILALPKAAEEVVAVLFHVFQENPQGLSIGQVAGVRHAEDEFRRAGVRVQLEEASGDPVGEIAACAHRVNADMICIGGRKRTPIGKALFGSVAQQVILGADRPVLICGSGDNG